MQDWRIQVELHHVDCIVYADRLGMMLIPGGRFFCTLSGIDEKGV